ncbi:phosphoribosylglycinamide formyltransferase [Riemerella anatipestifer]|uniref:phosphoribosylglycinamide formyltransferase n=1 Tax=Riemerella anatipestifer TaxID=34085 RepID=UPI00129DD894|nr:phosphoribosylglycinamide formyltransferase [Riemerella anatipestifer]MDY3318413.1 phosphoribosylglycinamide formyltransferase [Riemerella anatipestifer]MDY3324682.1 phosphoribosylglycinamide formyltransferase [Riemerella anatipestifer]MDY3353492.1 phosphoribosylglycinamide formyltransferase [Riemerella anatipestifer]MRM82531.1 phosphoribosylglycinamide formyltransferase [Riemerella anatipestifer]
MKNIVVLVSGSGSNLQRLIEAIENKEISNAQISMVVADRDCYGLERARNHGIETLMIKRGKNFSSELKERLPKDVDLIVLAGFLSIIKSPLTEEYQGRMINLHPSLLPKFGGKGMWGMNVHEAVLEAGEKETGATVHFVTSGIDEGDIILQDKVEITPNDTAESIAAKVHKIEYEILPKAVEIILNDLGKV